MDEQTSAAPGDHKAGDPVSASYRVLSVRLNDDTRAQLEVLSQLNERSLTEEVRMALEDWVARSKSTPAILERAEKVRAQIEHEADVRRRAIAAVFGSATSTLSETPGRASRRSSPPRTSTE